MSTQEKKINSETTPNLLFLRVISGLFAGARSRKYLLVTKLSIYFWHPPLYLPSQKRSQEWATRVLLTLNLLALRGKYTARVSCAASGGSRSQPPPSPPSNCAASDTVADATGEEREGECVSKNENMAVLGTESEPIESAPMTSSDDRSRRLSARESNPGDVDDLLDVGETAVDRVVGDSDGVGDEGGQDKGCEEKREKEQGGGKESSSEDQPTFVLVTKEHLVGTWLAVFVRASMFPHVSDVRSGKKRRPGWNKAGVTYSRWEGEQEALVES